MHPFGKSKYFKEPPVNSGYRIPRSPAMPQHGIPEPVTSSAHFSASFVNVCSTPSFLDEHGTWMAMCFFTLLNSSLSSKWFAMNSAGSYKENLKAGFCKEPLISAKQGEVSTTIGYLPFSDASNKASSICAAFVIAVSLKPLESVSYTHLTLPTKA